MIRNDETKRKRQRSTSEEKVSVAGISGARGSPLLPPPRHTRLTNETLSYVCSNYCRHSAYTRSTQRALKYYPRHLAPFPVPHEKPPNGRSSSFVVVVAIAIIAVVVVVLVVVVVIPFFCRDATREYSATTSSFSSCQRTRFFYPTIWHEREAWPCSLRFLSLR